MEPARIPEEFPAPEFRPTQERALAEIRDAFAAGNEVVLVRAPTGSGKSLLARAVAGSAARGSGASATDPVGAYYTTPQVSQLDDVAADPLLQDLSIIRGKNNYDCILPGETDTPVDRAPCARERGFDCQVEHRCPYFSDRAIAANRAIAAMTLAYFMQTAGSTVFGTRDVVVVDEAHGLGDWAEMYATIDLGPRTVPGWAELTPGPVESLDDAAAYAQRLRTACERGLTELRRQAELTPDETARRDRLSELRSDLGWFLEEYRNPESPTTWVVDQAEPGDPVTITPMNPERYLKHTVWDRGRRFALFSATILDGAAFCASVGLDTDRVALVDVPHTFPVEHRPLYDVTQGKMTYDRRDETLPALAVPSRSCFSRSRWRRHSTSKGRPVGGSCSVRHRTRTHRTRGWPPVSTTAGGAGTTGRPCGRSSRPVAGSFGRRRTTARHISETPHCSTCSSAHTRRCPTGSPTRSTG